MPTEKDRVLYLHVLVIFPLLFVMCPPHDPGYCYLWLFIDPRLQRVIIVEGAPQRFLELKMHLAMELSREAVPVIKTSRRLFAKNKTTHVNLPFLLIL